MKLKPPFKSIDSKYPFCDWIVRYFPTDYQKMVYLEPFCGTASVFLNKHPSTEEVINDIEPKITKLMRSIRDQHKDLMDILRKVKYTKENFINACEAVTFINDLYEGANEYIIRNMGKERVFKSGDQQKWLKLINCIPKLAKRLEHSYIFNKPAIDVINAYNKADTLLYIDPPLDINHDKFAVLLHDYKGKVIISGQSACIYSELYKDWKCIKKKPVKINNHECVWYNY